jgi:hypothetical protein
MRIHLVLAYAPGLPEGNTADRLEFCLPISAAGQPDEADTGPHQALRRLPDGRERPMELLREGGAWALRRTSATTDPEDAPLWTMEARVFRPGELVQLQRPNGETLTFRVVNVEAE